jgi:hypothetical protein
MAADDAGQHVAGDVLELEHAAGRDLSGAGDDEHGDVEQFGFAAIRGGDGGFDLCWRRFSRLLPGDTVAPVKISMRQVMKTILLAGAVVFGLLHSARAFSLAGPIGNGGDAWQVQDIGYGPPSDDVAPKNLGEEYRRNTKVMYYAYDQAFLDYFGSNGVVAVNGAFTIMNNLTNVSSYSTGLSEFPLESRHINYQAQALGLFDLKSFTLGILVRQMGLADPVQYTWTLHDRYQLPNTTCPQGMEYLVVQRNFDIVSSPLNQIQYSPYVNDTLYTYFIDEVCQGASVLALAVPIPVDYPLADTYSALASLGNISWGDFYTGLTRDDVAGLRYLLKTNNINFESPAPGALLLNVTTNLTTQQLYPANTNAPFGFGTFDLGLLISSSRTNDPATLQTLFPGVIVATSSNYFTLGTNVTVSSYFTNYIGSPIGSPPVLVVVTNYNFFPLEIFVDTFANIVTNHYSTNTTATIQTTTVAPQNGAPIGSPSVTNTTSKTIILTNVPSGDYYVLSPDLCPVDILYTLLTNVITTTNLITGASTNVVTTNTTTFAYSQSIVTHFTNYIFVVNPVNCTQTTNGPGLYQGIENVKFVQADFDSLLGQFFQPITNNYTMVLVANSQTQVQQFQRIVAAPDFLIDAQDMAQPLPVGAETFGVNINFDTANVLPGLAGPGTITPSTTITFDKVGPVYFNDFADLGGTNYFVASPGGGDAVDYYSEYFLWASYDGTTNAPVVYPDGTSIDNLENEVLIQITPTSVPSGFSDTPYPAQTFTATGGAFTPPFTWSATGLPSGLNVSSDGTLSGTPTESGTFDFTLQLTDSLGRSVQFIYPITIQ